MSLVAQLSVFTSDKTVSVLISFKRPNNFVRIEDHVFELSLKTDVPIATAAGVSVGGSLGTNWKYSNNQGLVKEGLSDRGEYVYFPLYSLKGVSWGRVGSIVRGTKRETEVEEVWVSTMFSILSP